MDGAAPRPLTASERTAASPPQAIKTPAEAPSSAPISPSKPQVAAAAAPPRAAEAEYVALADFHTTIQGGVFVAMKRGQVVPPHLVAPFKSQGLPIASPAEEEHLIACPHCKLVFDLRAARTKRAASAA